MLIKVLFSGVFVLAVCSLYGAADINQAVRDYASFYNINSSGSLESFKNCFVPEERNNIFSLPTAQEKKVYIVGEAFIVDTKQYGNICEVKYHTGNPQEIENVVLKKQDGEWFVSSLYTANLLGKFKGECAARLQKLFGALSNFSMSNNGRFPAGNDAAGWEELRMQSLIKSSGDYLCPQSNQPYNYIGGKSTSSGTDAPLAWCSKHVENGKLSNVLLINGKVVAMASPTSYVPSFNAAPVANTAPQSPAWNNAPAAPAAPAWNNPAPAATPAVAVTTQTPADWVKGPDESWYVHYDDAVAAAKRENKKILLLHTCSDWCGWCKKLVKDVLSRDEFKNFANGRLVLLYFDSPSKRHPMGQDQRNHVESTKRKLGISGGYPKTFILDANGQQLGSIRGYKKIDGYIEALKKYVGNDEVAAPANTLQPQAPAPAAASGWITAPSRSNYFASSRRSNSQTDSGSRNDAAGKSAAPSHWLKGPTPDWYIHLDDAVAAAKRTGRKIYALRTGSDWCPPCKYLEKTILSTSKFKKFAKNNIILLFVDAPRRKPIPNDQKAYNNNLARQLNFGVGVPTILLLDADGKAIDHIEGLSSVDDHINAIKAALAKHK